MKDSLQILAKQTGEIWRQFGSNQRTSIIVSLMIAVGAVVALVSWSARTDYRLLYNNLSLEDCSKMREKLEESKIPVQLGQSGMSISVPADKLYSARLLLAADGLPGDQSVGFELFEQPKFGLTDFAQKVNYQRALQGELERTIAAMQGVRSARVMLVLPKDRLFSTEKDQAAQASVLLNLNGSIALGDDQVQSIVHLIASSVQKLTPANVTVTDQNGNLLTRSSTIDTSVEAGNEQLAVQERTEKSLVEKAQAILDRALGEGNSIVRVNVNLDFSDVEERHENYDAENRVATSEHITTSDRTTSNNKQAGGRASIVANVAVDNPADMKLDVNGNKDKTEEIITAYAIPSKVSTVHQKGVRVTHLSVAVCLAQLESGARTDAEIRSITQLVGNALGVNATRADTIHVTEMPFVAPLQPADASWWQSLPMDYNTLFKGVGGLIGLCAVFGASRKVKNVLLASTPSLGAPTGEVEGQDEDRLGDETGDGRLVNEGRLVNGDRLPDGSANDEEDIEKEQNQEEDEMGKDLPGAEKPLELQEQVDLLIKLARDNPRTVAAWIANIAEWNV